MASLHYLAKYQYTKIVSTESTATADEACATAHSEENHKNATVVGELALSQ